ncbi:uncharacterized protein [Leptinotarsa decemlineata]|uniref:uncharacterized protein n=1 Tax=Leptinotarsa decemlineata TaxID=7539 RepID=UPI003D307E30
MPYITKSLTIIITLLSSFVCPGAYKYGFIRYTRSISLKQGMLQGVITEPKLGMAQRGRVGVYKGIPYAAPPIGELRFMPTGGAPSWFGVKIADTFGPVCPQKFPDERKMSPFRKKYFLGLKQYLMNQSEDCLYLNIYAPDEGNITNSRRYPVMVFIHGESFEWNSGNPYDGSVLAAYGQVIVVTINFRLGILGFLKAGTELDSKSNFGLVDQIAALLWVKDNIEAFGGDINSVTLFGHGTGAVCASLLMISPMILKGNERLFHRAILMGGTALSDWALAGNPTGVTYQVSKALNCQIHDDFAECLRRKRLDEIMAASAITPDYKTRFGPVVDSIVVPNEPKKSMTQYNDLFRRFELMYGVTEQESLHLLGPVALIKGMLEKERDQELRAYFHSRCEMRPGLCMQRTLDEYSRNDAFPQSDRLYGDYTGYEPDRASLARDSLLDILSDARSVAPIVQMARYHAALNLQSYFYVFTHRTNSKEYIRDKSYNGEELPYVFGVPLDGPKFHFTDTYREEERMFSEIVMMYFSNFAETGNPNMPKRQMFYSMNPAYWAQYDVEWPEFDLREERYIELKIPPQPSQHYRSSKIRYWNDIFPNLTENIPQNLYPQSHPTKRTPYKPPLANPPRRTPSFPSFLYDHLSTPKNKFENFEKPFKTKSKEVFGTIVNTGTNRPDNFMENIYGKVIEAPAEEVKQSSSMNIIIIIGGIFLMVNLILLVILYFKCYRNKKNGREKTTTTTDANEDEKRPKDEETFLMNGCNIVRMMNKSPKSEDTYEAVRSGAIPKHKLSRQMSSSTIDAHTKVREWIAQEIIHKYSPRFFRRTEQNSSPREKVSIPEDFTIPSKGDKDSTLGRSPTRPVSPVDQKPIIMKTSTVTRHKVKVPKVSVAVDATPSGRGPSVLMQQPIEFTKSLDYPNIKPDGVPLRRSFTVEDFSPRISDKHKDTRISSNNIHFNLEDLQPTVIKISHTHSKSDPVQDVDYTAMKRLRTFDPNQSVNVTCKDENDQPIPLTPEESLKTIKRRNFPKVLPDLPSRQATINKRLSMPIQGLYMPANDSSSVSPTNSPLAQSLNKFPPAPPPRASTLIKQSSSPLPVFISEPALAEEQEEEPEIVCNNLYVGPLIPRRQPGNNIQVYGSLGSVKNGNGSKTTISSSTELKNSDPKLFTKPPLMKKPFEDSSIKIIPKLQHNNNHKKEKPNRIPEEKTDNLNASVQEVDNQCQVGVRPLKKSQIPTLSKNSNATLNKESSSSESTPSEESDTGTIVNKI